MNRVDDLPPRTRCAVAPPRESGMALILVILVLSALLAIGTPFVISMKLQERGSVHTVAQRHADHAANSARNHAVAHLFNTHPAREREFVDDEGVGAHKYDTIDELQPQFATALDLDAEAASDFLSEGDRTLADREGAGALGYPMRGNFSGRTIDAAVEDEQGKINLNTAMPNLLGNLLAGSHLSESVKFDQQLTELPLEDTTPFPTDGDPDTVDGVVVILNPIFFTAEAISYRGKTKTHLTGCFRGEYISGTWEHQAGWPVFDIRGLKVFLHRYYDLGDGIIDTYRTPQAIREIGDWSVIPYFLETMAVIGLDVNNMEQFGLTPEMLVRADLGQLLEKLQGEPLPYDEEAYEETRRNLLELGIPAEAIDLVEQFRGKAGVVEVGRIAKNFDLDKTRANAFRGIFESTIKQELKRLRNHAKGYFPAAIEAYKEIYDLPGMETFTATDFERIRDSITTYSAIDALWSSEQAVLGTITTEPILGVPSFRLARYDHFNPGTLVRIRSVTDPAKTEYQLVAGAFPSPGGRGRGPGRGGITQGGVILKDRLKFEYDEREAVVSAQLRHPVNINSAPPKVIEAVLTGLSQDRFSRNFDSVTSTEARRLTEVILEERPIRDIGHLEEVVRAAFEEEVIDDEDVATILLNAVNPNHPRLSISTTGFCYASGDVFTVEASGVVRNPSGVATGTRRFREVIEVAPPDPLEFTIDAQDEWTAHLFRRPAASIDAWPLATTWIPGRGQHLMTTAPVPLQQQRFEAPALDVGGLTAVTLESPNVQGVTESVEHFVETFEGLEDGAHAFDVSAIDPRSPMAIDLWLKPQNLAADQTIFDSLADPLQPFENRIRLLWRGSSRELVLQIYDDARRTNFGGRAGVLPAAEVTYEWGANAQPDTWTHVTAAWASARPGDQLLLVDQRSVGESSWISTLAQPLDDSVEGFVNLTDADVANRYPADGGSLWVGGEVIDYVRRDGTRFQVGARTELLEVVSGRGRRGTLARRHPQGTTVRPFGYSVPLVPSDPDLAVATPGVPIGGTGGAGLASELLPARRSNPVLGQLPGGAVIVQPDAAVPPRASEPTIQYSTALGGAWLEPFLPGQVQLPMFSAFSPDQLGFGQRGYLEVVAFFRPQAGNSISQREIVRFEGWGAAGQGRYVFNLIGRAQIGTTEINTGVLSGAGIRSISVRQISLETNVSDLHTRYPPSGVVQITPVGGQVEWVRYTQILEGRFFVAAPLVVQTSTGPVSLARTLRYFDDILLNKPATEYGGLEEPPPTWAAETALVPVLRTVRAAPETWDRVEIAETVSGGSLRREPSPLLLRKVIEGDDGVFVGLDRATSSTYSSEQVPVLLRFPTGELPRVHSGTIVVGTSAEGGAGTFAGTIDEVRLSTLGPPGNWGLFVTDAAGRPRFEETTFGAFLRRVPVNDVRASEEVTAGGGLDRIRLIPLPELSNVGGTLTFSVPTAGQFAAGRNRFLLGLGEGEILFGERQGGGSAGTALISVEMGNETDNLAPTLRRAFTLAQVPLESSNGLPPQHGFLSIETNAGLEILYYERAQSGALRNVQRGMFGTPMMDLSRLSAVTAIGATVLETVDIDLRARSLLDSTARSGTLETITPFPLLWASLGSGGITDHFTLDDGGPLPAQGYLRLDDGNATTADEIVGYVGRAGTEFRLGRDDFTGRPLFRARYGSPLSTVGGDTVFVEFLPRYPDRFEPEAESGDLMKWERAVSIPGARFDRVSWELTGDRSGAGRAQVVVMTRLDGMPMSDTTPLWHTKPGEGRDEISLFTDREGQNTIGRVADRIDLRIMLRFPEGAYGPAGAGGGWSQDWKRVPLIDSLTLEYHKDWRILHREDLPF